MPWCLSGSFFTTETRSHKGAHPIIRCESLPEFDPLSDVIQESMGMRSPAILETAAPGILLSDSSDTPKRLAVWERQSIALVRKLRTEQIA